MSNELNIYSDLLVGIKNRVRQGQIKAYVAVNAELLATYWDIGKMIHERQQQEEKRIERGKRIFGTKYITDAHFL